MWVKRKFVLCELSYYNLLNEKKYKKIHVFEVLIFLNTYRYCQSQEILLKHHFRWYIFGKFYIVKFNNFSDIIRWKKGLEIFLIDRNAGEIGIKNIAVKY